MPPAELLLRAPSTDQAQTPYADALAAHAGSAPACFNVPSHKAGLRAGARLRGWLGARALALDVPPLIPGIDDGGRPTPFQRAQDLAAEAWGAERTWFTVNGASNAVHAACMVTAQRPGAVLMQRNVHGSAVDGVILAGLEPHFVTPAVDPALGIPHCVEPAALERALAEIPGVATVFLISPTYHGSCADLPALAEIAHAADAALVVDEAWGSHLRFHEAYPTDALSAGADLVISSTHKLGGSLTQSAMLHLGHASRFAPAVVERAVTMLESTSPSALLSGSLDLARHELVHDGRALLERTLAARGAIDAGARALRGIDVLDERSVGRHGVSALDPLRLCLDVRATGRSGYGLKAGLARRGVFVEMAGEGFLLAILAPGDTDEDCARLFSALRSELPSTAVPVRELDPAGGAPLAERVLAPRAAHFARQVRVPLESSAGSIAAETLAVYPPGMPNVILGERLTDTVVALLVRAREEGLVVRGASDRTLQTLAVVA
jgi:lysine decarboxylase